MRGLLIVPLALLLCVAAGWAVCRAIGLTVSPRDALLATGICLLSGELSMLPLLLTRGAKQMAVSQAGLVATVAHLMLAIALAGGVYLAKIGTGPAFIYWMLALYCVTLIVLVACSVRAVKLAPPETSVASTKQ